MKLRDIIFMCIGIWWSLIYYCFVKWKVIHISLQITLWEILEIVTNVILAIFLLFIGYKIEKRNGINSKVKEHIFNELTFIEQILHDLNQNLEGLLGDKKQNIEKFAIVLQSKIKHIANKVDYIENHYKKDNNSRRNFCLRSACDTFRTDVTETIRNSDFAVDSKYYQLFTKVYNNFLIKIAEEKEYLLKWE